MRVLIVDDYPVVRTGLRRILEEAPERIVVGEAATGSEALQQVHAHRWTTVVLDISLPDRSGLDVLKQIKAESPELPVLVLTMHAEHQYAVRAVRAGASGFLTKDCAPEQLLTAIRKLAQGGRYLTAQLAEDLAFDLAGTEPTQLHETLSDREFQVLCLLASGQTVTSIARRLCVSVKTVSTHRSRILSKMSMTSNAELIQYALRNRLLA